MQGRRSFLTESAVLVRQPQQQQQQEEADEEDDEGDGSAGGGREWRRCHVSLQTVRRHELLQANL